MSCSRCGAEQVCDCAVTAVGRTRPRLWCCWGRAARFPPAQTSPNSPRGPMPPTRTSTTSSAIWTATIGPSWPASTARLWAAGWRPPSPATGASEPAAARSVCLRCTWAYCQGRAGRSDSRASPASRRLWTSSRRVAWSARRRRCAWACWTTCSTCPRRSRPKCWRMQH